MKRKVMVGMLAVLTAVAAGQAKAQVFSPTYLAPRVADEAGIYVSDSPGDLTVEGSLRGNFSGTMLGLRGGIADMNDIQLTVGAELLHPLSLNSAPLDIALTGAAQAVFGDPNLAGFTVGIDVGHTFTSPGLSVTPYLHPRIGLTDRDPGDSDVDLLADLGVNVDLAPNLSLRLGIGLTGPEADWGFGVAWRR